jgi:hypothetical protein
MQRKTLPVLIILLLVLPMLSLRPSHAEPRCFPEAAPAIQHCIDERFIDFWEQNGGLAVFGYPLSGAYEEDTEVGPVTMQFFERARLEFHPDNPPPYNVQLSHLGKASVSAPHPPQQPQAGCIFFSETGQNVCPPFLNTWRSHGLDLGTPGISDAESVALFGLPLTPAIQQTLSNGQVYTVQWFERARMEDHGEQGVLLGLLGRELAGLQTTAWQPPQHPQDAGGFIEVSGSQLTRLGNPVRLKGVNYYPQWRPWAEMWDKWSGEQMERELRLARDQLGINAVRILLPYDVSGEGDVDAGLIRKLREATHVAGLLNLRLIVTLFDFHQEFPQPGTSKERRQFEYLERLIGNFRGDERIFAWDLHNEPDHYDHWKNGHADEVLTWLGRMADKVHELAPHHLVTVGMGQYHNLLQAGPDGRRVIDYSDVISVHIYNPDDAVRQLDELRRHTSKPIIIQEFGWPSGPPCTIQGYTEAQQEYVYRTILIAAEGRAQGVFAWTLRDYDAGPTQRWDTREEHYGLYRPDNTLKPAALVLRDYNAPPLPGITIQDVALTPDRDWDRTGIRIPETGYHIKKDFLLAWELLGGRGSLGLPISNAFVRPDDGRIVQYFEAAVLELHNEPDDKVLAPLTEQQKAMHLVKPDNIGRRFASTQSFPPPGPPPADGQGRHFPETGYSVQGDFWAAYENLLGPWRLGAAISGEIVETVNGTPVRMQYFERGRLEQDPVHGNIYPGHLGTWEWNQKCEAVH